MTDFKSFGLPEFIIKSLTRMNITVPTPVQGKSIPPALEGRDILASAQTGTGKTIAYLLPVLANLQKDERSTALILAPTRELAAQIQEAARNLLDFKMSVALLIGGDPMHKQISALKKNPRIIVGTPGRIVDHLNRRTLRLGETRFLVLDETDRMLDMGFSEDLKKIISLIPEDRQTFMFSATMPSSIKTLSLTYLKDPKQISVGSTTEPILKIKQESLQTSANDKYTCLVKELNTREGSVIIFVKTKHGADRLADKLSRQNHEADAIHGDLKQRKRDQVIKNFRNMKKRIMVATDVAARGLDIPHIMHVINYDLPQCPEDYIHRIGRTGRAGMEGFALSLIAPEDNHKWRRIHNLITLGQSDTNPNSSGRSERREKKRPFRKFGESKFGPSKKPSFRKADSKRGGPFRTDESKPTDFKRGEPFKSTDSTRGDSFKSADPKRGGFKKGSRFKSDDSKKTNFKRGNSFKSADSTREDSFKTADSKRGNFNKGNSFKELIRQEKIHSRPLILKEVALIKGILSKVLILKKVILKQKHPPKGHQSLDLLGLAQHNANMGLDNQISFESHLYFLESSLRGPVRGRGNPP